MNVCRKSEVQSSDNCKFCVSVSEFDLFVQHLAWYNKGQERIGKGESEMKPAN
jgi:hypothetical protein